MMPSGSNSVKLQARLLMEALPWDRKWKGNTDEDFCETRHACDAGPLNLENIYLWTIFVGGVSAAGAPERGWFAREVYETCMDLELKTWDDVKSALKSVAWVEKMCGISWSKLWYEGKSA